jgi:hypothetical protein
VNNKPNSIQGNRFSLVTSTLKSARKLLGLEREPEKKLKYEKNAPVMLRSGEFPAVNLKDDPIAQLVTKL